ncbi:Abhydrolase_3 domain-containing protein [Trichoderma simmonsii]|uniref:Abhydrolase_3 domain-containing protein n=1 Tax=Trichoderma simmonsii TaxID=1491479 RepID=A0A8G0PK22_9HYPO|nr:Abhydrolase_3 domain-containing protein [Trichoderma simmonsii]
MAAYSSFAFVMALIKAAVLHCLRRSPTASLLDLKTAVFLALVRSSTSNLKPGRLIDCQQDSLRDLDVKERIYLVSTKLTLTFETNIIGIAFKAIRNLGDGQESIPDIKLPSVSMEWICHRPSSDGTASDTDTPERVYATMMREVKNKTTILYFHGGQFWRMGREPRRITHELARDTGGRCLAVRYRLSPQNPFPTALIEGLAAYLYLLYPPAGSLHAPVAASDICFAGDSAGGNLAIALVQLILEITREGSKNVSGRLTWDGQERDLPVPAGVSILSPYNDLTRALDSESNLQYDIIPARGPPFTTFDPCEIWPANPPRHHVYANDNALLNPLVSPVTAHDWSGAPPTWICVGEECLADQGMFVAQRMASQGVPVILEQYSAMPHNFSLLIPEVEASKCSKKRWASFICSTIDDPDSITTEAMQWSGNPLVRTELNISELVPLSLESLKEKMETQIKEWGSPPL